MQPPRLHDRAGESLPDHRFLQGQVSAMLDVVSDLDLESGPKSLCLKPFPSLLRDIGRAPVFVPWEHRSTNVDESDDHTLATVRHIQAPHEIPLSCFDERQREVCWLWVVWKQAARNNEGWPRVGLLSKR